MPPVLTRQPVGSGNGLLAARPAANTVPAGYIYFATDDNGGTPYRSDGTAWAKMGAGVLETGGRELPGGYAEITSSVPTVSGSSTFADVPGWAITVTPGARPIMVEAWCGIFPSTDTAGGGGKYRIVRTDTGVTIAESDANNPIVGPLALFPLRRRLSLAAGTPITFKVQIAGRTSGIATFTASPDLPLAIRAVEG